jgi:hypothetical protein
VFSNLFEAFVNSIAWSLPALVAAVLAIFFVWKRYTDDLWWADFWVSAPLVGKMRRWKRQTHGIENRQSWSDAGLPPAEESLCSTYIDKLPKTDPEVFSRSVEYLKITHQNGRSSMSSFMMLALLLLTIAEAAGTGLLIAPFVASEITGNQMVWIGYVIATVMAAGLLGLTHTAGKEVFKWSAIRKAIGSVSETVEGYTGEKINSGDDQSGDKDASAKVRFGSRVLDGAHDRGSLFVPIIAVALLAVLLAGITWMRIKGLQIDMTHRAADQVSSGAGNPFASVPGLDASMPLPNDIADASRSAQHNVNSELSSEMFSQGIAGAIVLAIIYLITQALGFFQAFNSTFIGDGKNAYRQTHGHTSFQSYFSKEIKPALDRGNMRLTELRTHLGREVPKYREQVSKVTCHEFYNRRLHEEAGHRLPKRRTDDDVTTSDSRSTTTTSGSKLTAPQEPQKTVTPQPASPGELDRIAERIIDEPNSERRKVILDIGAENSQERRKAILEAVKQIKARREAAEADARLEDDILGSL